MIGCVPAPIWRLPKPSRRLHAGNISSDAHALAYLADRIQRSHWESSRSVLLESEVKDIMRNLLESAFFRDFENCRQRKAEVIRTGIDPYRNIIGFVPDQMSLYGLGGRGWQQIESVVVCGIATNICCYFAARDLRAAGFRVLLVEDASAGVDRGRVMRTNAMKREQPSIRASTRLPSGSC